MKYIAIAGIAIVVGVGILHQVGSTTEVNNVKEVIIEEVIPENLRDIAADEEAVQAAKDVLQRKAWEIELKEKAEARDVLDAEIEVLEKSLGYY